jgi:arylsulfatase A-like enzyme
MSESRPRSVRDAAVAGAWVGGGFGLVEAWRLCAQPPAPLPGRGAVVALLPALVLWLHCAAGASGLSLARLLATLFRTTPGLSAWFAIGAGFVAGGARLAALLAQSARPAAWAAGLEVLAVAGACGIAASALGPRLVLGPVGSRPLLLAFALTAAALWGGIATSLRAGRIWGPDSVPRLEAREPATGPNVLLLTVDTLRADALGCYGNGGARTPHLDGLASRAVLFESAHAASPWTLASLTALFTSRFPSERGTGRTGEEEGRVLDRFLLRRPPRSREGGSLPGVLARAGYATEAQVTNVWCEARFGLDDGFARYRRLDRPGWMAHLQSLHLARLVRRLRSDPDGDAARARPVTDAAIASIDRLRDRRFFLWVHYLDPHLPYDAPGSARPVPLSFLEDVRVGRVAPASALPRAREAYAEEVSYADREIGRLLAHLRARDLERETLVVLTSDHGEEFGEHGGFEHGHSLHDEVLRVPLLLAFPGGRHAGRRVAPTVSLLDLAPTIRAVAGLPPDPGAEGASLLPLLEEAGAPAPRTAFSESLLYGEEAKSLRTERWRLILRHGESEPLVLDYARDPAGERADRTEDPDVRGLRDRLLEWARRMRGEALKVEAHRAADPGDAETERSLRALGYLR